MNVCFLYSAVLVGEGVLDLRPSDVKDANSTTVINAIARRHHLRTVGELYDFTCEHGLFLLAEIL